jgi:hypothetical protein
MFYCFFVRMNGEPELTSPISGSKGSPSPAWRDGRGDVSPRKLGLQEFKKKSKIVYVALVILHCVERVRMNEIKTVDDLLKAKNVTPEERELLKDIIEIARTNERKIREYAEQMRANFNRLSQALQTMEERTFILNKALQGLLDATDTLHLKLMPSEKFYRE